MTKTTTLTAAAVVAAAAAAATQTASDAHHKTPAAAPRIYGGGSPAAAPTPVLAPEPTAGDAEDLARRWTLAFDCASDCPAAAGARRAIVHLATGQLATQLADPPPRPGAQADCHPENIVAVKAAGPPDAGGTWKVFVQHKGETGGPLTLTLLPTNDGLRVASLDY